MRSRILIVMITAAALLVFGSTANALYVAHQEANTVSPSGDCAACHIPHKSPSAKRGFPIAPSGAAVTTYGYIGAFCMEKCHLNVTATTGDGGNLSWANTASTVAGGTFGGGAAGTDNGSHGMNLLNSGANAPYGTRVASTLPYGDSGNGSTKSFECTTCHNVHDNASGDTSNALLMLDIDALCDECHINRGAGDGAWGSAVYGALNTVGSHPVGTDVNNDEGGAASPIRVGIGAAYGSTAFDAPYGTTTRHNLGGHLINGVAGADGASPVTCVTCHAVHGIEADAGDANPTGGMSGREDLLVIAQGISGASEPNRHANGAGDTNNALCEGCHVSTGPSGLAGGWNPGGTAFSHPADAMADSDFLTAGNQAIPDFGNLALTNIAGSTAEWPFGPVTGNDNIGMGVNATGGGPRVICESCHTPHPNANVTAGASGYTGVPATGTPILRRTPLNICGVCHSSSYARHHPVGAGLLLATAFKDDIIGNADTDLTCGDCHNGTSLAHNWTGANGLGLALDADWEPANNGRTADSNAARYQANTSKECYDCHFGGTTARFSPTKNLASATDIGGNVNYDDFGDGSHFLGAIAGGFAWDNGYYNSAVFNASTTAWPGGGWSRFGGSSSPGQFVCESCHELQPTKNVNNTPLLLAYFMEGNTAVTGRTPERYASEFCEGCHGRTPGGNITHPMTGTNVTKAVDLVATPYTLITTGTRSNGKGSYADNATAPAPTNYPAANAMNCDTCHQVHDAATTGGTYILDAPTSMIVGPTPRSASVTLYGGTISRSVTTDVDYAAYCTACHAY